MKKNIYYLNESTSLELLLVTLAIFLSTSLAFLLTENRFFEPEILIFGIPALICSVLTGLRFWNVYYGLPFKDREKGVYPYGSYREVMGQATLREKGLDWAISITGGALLGLSFIPKGWFISAFSLYFLAFYRHSMSLKRKDWRKGIPSATIGKINSFLEEKRRSTIAYMALFFIGIIVAWYPYLINSLLTWITENPKYTVGVWVVLILVFRYIFRFIREQREEERFRIIFEDWFRRRMVGIGKAIRKKIKKTEE